MYRDQLPQLGSDIFLTDGGLETTLVFIEQIDLPHFAAFDLLSLPSGEEILRRYFEPYLKLARESRRGLILETPTWRASADWGARLGYSRDELAAVNRRSVAILEDLRQAHQGEYSPMVISGCVGPRGDGYAASSTMSVEEARDYHSAQIETFANTQADLICALTINYLEEAVGIALAARDAGIPAAISFTTEVDGCLPDGMSLKEAITTVDEVTANAPAYYMINCAHPEHFAQALESGEPWVQRLRGIRANASRKSHAELDNSEELDRGNPRELGLNFRELRNRLPQLTVLGGCCGTDAEHIGAIARCC